MRRAPPPSGSAPQMGLEALEVVKKKVSAPPRGPPPAGMTVNFKGPRQIERHPNRNRSDSRDYSDHDDHRAGGKDDPPRRQGHASQQAPPAAVKQKAPPTAEAKAAVAAPSSGAA
eukprot:gene18360-22051_t